jgi:hypothetical protein
VVESPAALFMTFPHTHRPLLSDTPQFLFNIYMSLFPEENILTKEIESWKGFANSLKSDDDKRLFLDMLEKCQKYAVAINAKGKSFPTEPLIMALLLEQHKMINWLQNKILIPKQRFFGCSPPENTTSDVN